MKTFFNSTIAITGGILIGHYGKIFEYSMFEIILASGLAGAFIGFFDPYSKIESLFKWK